MIGLSGRFLLAVAAVGIGLAVFWVYGSIDSIAGSSVKTTSGWTVPILEPGDEEPTANRSEAYVPVPILVPAPTQTSPSEPAEIAADPQVSEAGEIAWRESFAEGSKKPDEAAHKDAPLRGASSSPASLPPEPILPQTKSPLSDSTSLGSPPSENTPALYQGPARPMAEPYADETMLPTPLQIAPSDTPTTTEETTPPSPPPPPEPVTDTESPNLLPKPLGEPTTSSSDLPADSPPFTEDTADLE